MSDLELQLHDPSSDQAEIERQQAEEDADLKWLVADPRGRRIVRRMLDRTGVWRLSHTGEALSSAFREGERNVGLQFVAVLLRAAPETASRIIAGQDGK